MFSLTIQSLKDKAIEQHSDTFSKAVKKRNKLLVAKDERKYIAAVKKVDDLFHKIYIGNHSFHLATGERLLQLDIRGTIVDLCNRNQILSLEATEKLLDQIQNTRARRGGRKRANQLIKLLELALKLKEPIHCTW